MKTMTTAEFGRANLAAIEEPVEIRRYTKVVGVYYPSSFSPSDALPLPAEPVEKPVLAATRKKVEELEDEVKRLKKELAARPVEQRQPPTGLEALFTPRERERARQAAPAVDASGLFDALPKQDREFFQRKLGRGKK